MVRPNSMEWTEWNRVRPGFIFLIRTNGTWPWWNRRTAAAAKDAARHFAGGARVALPQVHRRREERAGPDRVGVGLAAVHPHHRAPVRCLWFLDWLRLNVSHAPRVRYCAFDSPVSVSICLTATDSSLSTRSVDCYGPSFPARTTETGPAKSSKANGRPVESAIGLSIKMKCRSVRLV